MPKYQYLIRPLEHGLSTEIPSIHLPGSYSPSVQNVTIKQRSIMNRWGYGTAYRDLGSSAQVQNIVFWDNKAGSTFTLYLTDTDLCYQETGTGKTWSFKTNTGDYNSSVASIVTDTVTFKASTIADTEDIAVGDKFILDVDLTADEELDTNWREIKTVNKSGGYFTSVVLTATYVPGTVGDFTGAEKDCLIRRVYTTPTNERWTYAIVNDNFCFTNGNTNVQKWTGSGYATALDSTNAVKARYCLEYANRLVIADHGTTRDPYNVKWSKESDPTNWTDTTAGNMSFLENDEYITGLAKEGPSIVVFKENSMYIGYQQGLETDPFRFNVEVPGIGCVAPYSITNYLKTIVWIGKDDFYVLEGSQPIPLDAPESRIKYEFFDTVTTGEIKKTWGWHNPGNSEIMWIANTTNGKYAFVWNYKWNEWTKYLFAHDINCGGRGGK
jgi:hypothetical protein